MRICHVNLARGFSGGEQQTLNLLLGLAEQGIEQRLVCYRGGELASRARAAGIQIRELGHYLRGHRQAEPCDLIHAHCGRSVYWAAIEHRLRATPYVITRRVDNPLHQTFTTRWSYQHAARVVCLSRAIKAVLHQCLGPVKTAIIPSTYSTFSADPEQVAAIRQRWPGKLLVGQVGKLLHHKGHDTTLAAARALASSHPQLQFLILGDGPRRAELAQRAAALPNVSLLGHQSQIGNYIAALDLFLFPSLSEGLGSSILEAMQAGVPVIGSNAGGIPDLIEHGSSGILVPAGDGPALAAAIARLAEDPQRRQQLVASARQALAQFSPTTMTERYLALYHQLLA